jgi:hypothetical protein
MSLQFDPHRLWDKFRVHAVSLVRDGFTPSPQKGQQAVHLFAVLQEESFDDVIGWQVYEIACDQGPPFYLAQRTCWKQGLDSQRIFEPVERLALLRLKAGQESQPTIEYAAVTPDAARIVAARDRISALRLPLGVETNHFGLDGTSYELILGKYSGIATLRWWEEAPAEWRAAGEVVMALLEFLEQLYKESQ